MLTVPRGNQGASKIRKRWAKCVSKCYIDQYWVQPRYSLWSNGHLIYFDAALLGRRLEIVQKQNISTVVPTGGINAARLMHLLRLCCRTQYEILQWLHSSTADRVPAFVRSFVRYNQSSVGVISALLRPWCPATSRTAMSRSLQARRCLDRSANLPTSDAITVLRQRRAVADHQSLKLASRHCHWIN